MKEDDYPLHEYQTEMSSRPPSPDSRFDETTVSSSNHETQPSQQIAICTLVPLALPTPVQPVYVESNISSTRTPGQICEFQESDSDVTELRLPRKPNPLQQSMLQPIPTYVFAGPMVAQPLPSEPLPSTASEPSQSAEAKTEDFDCGWFCIGFAGGFCLGVLAFVMLLRLREMEKGKQKGYVIGCSCGFLFGVSIQIVAIILIIKGRSSTSS